MLLDQVPPDVASVKEVPLPTQTVALPEIPAGAPTVTDLETATQPGVVKMIFTVPAPTAVTIPPETVAIVELLDDQLPTEAVSVNVNGVPVQTVLPPEIAEGTPFTVKTVVA